MELSPEKIKAMDEALMPTDLTLSPEKIAEMDEALQEPQIREQSLATGIEDAYSQREKKLQEIGSLYEQGKQGKALTILQAVGQRLALGGDVAGEAFKMAGRGLSAITPDVIENPMKSGAEFAARSALNTPQGKMASTALELGKRGYNKLEEVSPSGARTLDAFANIGMATIPVTRGLKAANIKTIAPTAEAVAKKSAELYKKGASLGAEFSPKVLDDVYRAGFESSPLSGKGEIAKRLIKPDAADEYLGLLKSESGGKPNLDDFTAIDSHLGSESAKYFITDKALSRKFGIMQEALRESAENPANIIGSAEGVKAHKEAVRLWGIKKRMEDVERAIDIGTNNYDVPATGIRQQFARIKNSPKLMRGYTEKEKSLIKKAADTGEVEGLVKSLGSRLNIVAALATGNIGTAATAGAVSVAGRKGTELYRAAKGQKVLDSLANRSGLVRTERRTDKLVKPAKEAIGTVKKRFAKNKEVVEENIDKAPKLLGYTPESPIYKANRQGVASKMTQADKEVAELARKKATETGLTPDVRRSQIVNQVNKAYEQRGLQRNAIKEAEIAKIAEKSEVPIETLVELADKNIKELANLVGLKNSDTAFAAALKIAIKNKGKK